MRAPWNALSVFRIVAEMQNLRAASEALHLTHSAVSQQIKGLELRLGYALFERRGRRLLLNAAGAVLLGAVQSALAIVDEGMQAAAATAGGAERRLRISVPPSFAQRWLLPRMAAWRAAHPEVILEIETSQHVADLKREGFHAALRQGRSDWPGLVAERLFHGSIAMILVADPATARRLAGAPLQAFAAEPLLGEARLWQRWFKAAGSSRRVTPVAVFNDAGLLLSAVEQGLGLGLVQEMLAADALQEGRLVRLSSISVDYEGGRTNHLVYPPALQEWAPLTALRAWIHEELEQSRLALQQDFAATPGCKPPQRARRAPRVHSASSSG